MSSEFIKFDPEKIMEVSVKLSQQYNKFVQCTSTINGASEGLATSWLGSSSVLYNKKMKELGSESEAAAKILLSLSEDLATASGIYKTGESNAKQANEALPTDGVFLV